MPTLLALDAVCFHCQQAVEKCLKALLAARDEEYPHTHDLRVLCDLAEPLVPALEGFRRSIMSLSRYAVEVRYDDKDAPQAEQARCAVGTAEEVYQFAAETVAENAAPSPPDVQEGQ